MFKKVINEFGREVFIDESTKKLYAYNNKKKKITYNAEIVNNGKATGFWTNYTVYGTVDSIEERLETWNNRISLLYALSVGFKAYENDPNREKYNKIVEYVKANSDKFFTKTGDFRKKFLVNVEKLF